MLSRGIERRRLPRGAHGIPGEQIRQSQRRRLVAGMAEACANGGYLSTSVREISTRAGVSTQTFYQLFSDKLDCMLATHAELLDRLLAEIDLACAMAEGDGEGAVLRTAVRGALVAFAADPAAARLLTVEIMSAGPEGVKSHYRACERVATRLRGARSGDSLPPSVSWALIATMGMRVGKYVMDGEGRAVGSLEDEFCLLVSPSA